MAAKSSTKKAAPASTAAASAAPTGRAASAKKPAAAAKAPAKPPAKKSAAPAAAATKQTATKQTTKQKNQPAATATEPPAKATKPTSKQTTKPAATQTRRTPASSAGTGSPTPQSTRSAPDTMHELPKPKFNKEGLGYTKDFDLPFIKTQYDLLQQERVHLTGQAKRLEDEAHQLVEEAEMGDVQFDDEGGEGDTMVVERERDLALSAQARDAVAEIDAAIIRIMEGTYGYSVMSGKPLPRERLEAIPWSSVLVEEKVGGIGRR